MWFLLVLVGVATGLVVSWLVIVPRSFGTVGALTGALAGAVVSFTLNVAYPWFRVSWISWRLSFEPQNRVGHRVTARVRNRTSYVMRDAVAYVTINNELADVAEPIGDAFTDPRTRKQVVEDRLCWSIAGNPFHLDIYPDEAQSLDIAGFEDGTAGRIEIPSEEGWSSSRAAGQPIRSRVFLRGGKKYLGKISVVSADSRARVFYIEIDPNDPDRPLKLKPRSWRVPFKTRNKRPK